MNTIWRLFIANPAPWLSFFTTAIFGATTAYFAWRTRQLQRAQLRQINRGVDSDLADAESEVNKIASAAFYWAQWCESGGLGTALTVYGSSSGLGRPDLPKVIRILSFHIPELERDASDAVIRLHATLSALDLAVQSGPHSEAARAIVPKIEVGLNEARTIAERVLEQIKLRRQQLRAV